MCNHIDPQVQAGGDGQNAGGMRYDEAAPGVSLVYRGLQFTVPQVDPISARRTG